MVATVPSMIGQFNMNNIKLLQEMGYEVHVACDFNDRSIWPSEKVVRFQNKLGELGIIYHQVDFARNPFKVGTNIKAYKQLKQLFIQYKYSFAHCHTPTASVICRIVTHQMGTKCIYTAHGFHFYKDAPIINWLVFYPIEKVCSYWTDVLITINQEDYRFAKTHLKAKKVEYVPGVGVDVSKFKLSDFDIEKKRAELGICVDDIALLSVGELNQNKNHEVIVRAISELNNDRIHYFIAGQGVKEKELIELATKLNVNLHLLGYRTDIAELYNMADIFVFPSIREGLSVSLMEAMASGMPCIVSNIRGNVDLIEEGMGGYLCTPQNVHSFAQRMKLLIEDKELQPKFGNWNQQKMKEFDVECVNEKMKAIYNARERFI